MPMITKNTISTTFNPCLSLSLPHRHISSQAQVQSPSFSCSSSSSVLFHTSRRHFSMMDVDHRRKHPKWGSGSTAERKALLAKRLKRIVKSEDPKNMSSKIEGRPEYVEEWGLNVAPLGKDGTVEITWNIELHNVNCLLQVSSERDKLMLGSEHEQEMEKKMVENEIEMELDDLRMVLEVTMDPNPSQSVLRIFCKSNKDMALDVVAFRVCNITDKDWVKNKAALEKSSWVSSDAKLTGPEAHRFDIQSVMLTNLPESVHNRFVSFLTALGIDDRFAQFVQLESAFVQDQATYKYIKQARRWCKGKNILTKKERAGKSDIVNV